MSFIKIGLILFCGMIVAWLSGQGLHSIFNSSVLDLLLGIPLGIFIGMSTLYFAEILGE